MLKDDLPKIITDKLPGPKASLVIENRKKYIPNAIGCMYPVVIKRAEGAIVEDIDGNKFLDFIGGVGVLNIGYSHPEVIEVVKEQSEKYFHAMFNTMTHEGYVNLAKKLCSIAPVRGNDKKAYFANSGAEADENAVKIAKAYTKRPNIIVFSGAFHGRTHYTMAMTSKKAYAKGMGPLADGVFRAKFPYYYRTPKDIKEEDYLDYYMSSIYDVFEECADPSTIAAIVVEPLQGEGGFIPAPIEWVKAVRALCDKYGILLIADEVQSGICRTGRMYCTDYWKDEGIEPDILTSAKSIAAGIPLSAIIASKEIMDSVEPGVIGGTFGGNPLACSAALKVIEIMERDNFEERSKEIGEIVRKRYKEMQDKYNVVGDVRGIGAMIGIEFVKDKKTKEPAPELTKRIILECANNGLLVEGAGTYNNVIRFLAPLVITNEQLYAGLDIIENVIKACIK